MTNKDFFGEIDVKQLDIRQFKWCNVICTRLPLCFGRAVETQVPLCAQHSPFLPLTGGCFPITVEGGYSVATGACVIGDTIYDSLTDAIEAAQNGDTIVLMNNVNVTYADAVDAADGFMSFFVVSGKTITIDLNGKTVFGDATDSPVKMVNGQSVPEGLLLGMFTTLANGHLTLVDSSNGQGTVELKATTGLTDDNGMTYSYYAYGMIVNYDDD